jgi:flagellar basal-body rod protein FlgG
MNKMLEIGRSGMNAHKVRLDRISGNLANLETTGYKRMETSFAELTRQAMGSDSVALSESLPVDQKYIGSGVKGIRALAAFSQGSIEASTDFFHFAIEGPGFFGVRDSDGQVTLTRRGAFRLNQDGIVTDDNGFALEMALTSDPKMWETGKMTLSEQGILYSDHGSDKLPLATIKLYDVTDHNLLLAKGQGYYASMSQEALIENASQPDAFGRLKAYSLERSNVSLLEEMTQLMMTQRAYQFNAKSVASADEMMNMVNQIL